MSNQHHHKNHQHGSPLSVTASKESHTSRSSSHPRVSHSHPGNSVYKSMKAKHRRYRQHHKPEGSGEDRHSHTDNRNHRQPEKLPQSSRHSQPTRATTIGISGSPSSGKTSLAHLLYAVFSSKNSTHPITILHLDDFALPKTHIVPHRDGKLDADCRGAYNLNSFRRTLRYARKHGTLPPRFKSAHQAPTDGQSAMTLVDARHIEDAQAEVRKTLRGEHQPIVIVEGGQLFRSRRVMRLLDVKLLLRTTQKVSGGRRFNGQMGYTATEPPSQREWWQTPDYFDEVVWPNYRAQNAGLFRKGDVEGGKPSEECRELRIAMQPRADERARDVLGWSVRTICGKLSFQGERRERRQEAGSGRRRKPTLMQRLGQEVMRYVEERQGART